MYPTKIILHHSLTKDGKEPNWNAIRKWHKGEYPASKYKMRDIGYHFGIELIKDRYEIIVGRMLNNRGAHTKGQNSRSIGICLVGNFDKHPPLKEQWDLTLKFVSSLRKIFAISLSDIHGHCDFANKSCPGKAFDMKLFKSQLKIR